MALTFNNCVGFETGGLEEALATSGSPDATEATVVRSDGRSVKMASNGDQYDVPWTAGGVTDAGTDYVVGFGIRRDDATSGVINVECHDTSGFVWTMDFNGVGGFILSDANPLGNVIGTSAPNLLGADAWGYIEVYFQHSDPGTAEVFLNGASIIGPLTGEDLTAGGTMSFLRLTKGGVITSNYFFDDVYILSGATAAPDHLGDAEVFKYQSVKNSVTPDDGGSDLNAGTWNRAGETPLAATATNPEYTDAGAGAVDSNSTNGSPEGPLNDSRIQGEIIGMKGISNMQRSGGGGSAHFILMGNNVDGTTRSADIAPTTAFANYFFVSESASIIPEPGEYCRIGFETDGAQDYECKEQWVMLLHVPATIAELGLKPPLLDRRFRHHLVR